MKRVFFLYGILIAFAIVSCGTKQVHKNTDTTANPKNNKRNETTLSYEQEGFLSRDLFRVIVIRPFDSTMSDRDMERQLRNKASSSLKRHITSTGKSLDPNADAMILNLINDYGKTTPYDDKEKARTIFVLDISKPGCKGYVEGMAK
ncbi:MAG TPA: hypothetical protein VF857_03500 [Spirochaetota bacterium]